MRVAPLCSLAVLASVPFAVAFGFVATGRLEDGAYAFPVFAAGWFYALRFLLDD